MDSPIDEGQSELPYEDEHGRPCIRVRNAKYLIGQRDGRYAVTYLGRNYTSGKSKAPEAAAEILQRILRDIERTAASEEAKLARWNNAAAFKEQIDNEHGDKTHFGLFDPDFGKPKKPERKKQAIKGFDMDAGKWTEREAVVDIVMDPEELGKLYGAVLAAKRAYVKSVADNDPPEKQRVCWQVYEQQCVVYKTRTGVTWVQKEEDRAMRRKTTQTD